MSPYEEPSSDTLAQFLLNNEGERCVVVLDEIEKVEDPKACTLFSCLGNLAAVPLKRESDMLILPK
jgi:hypothetical protein